MLNWRDGIKAGLLLAIVVFCLFEFALRHQSNVLREYEMTLFHMRPVWLFFLCAWSGLFIFSSFTLIDLALVSFLLSVIVNYLTQEETISQGSGMIALLAGVSLGKGTVILLNSNRKFAILNSESTSKSERFETSRAKTIEMFLVGIVVLLAGAAWCSLDLDKADKLYQGPRWMGLWNNPNDYGILMGTGLTLAIGLLAGVRSSGFTVWDWIRELRCRGWHFVCLAWDRKRATDEAFPALPKAQWLPIILFIAAGMTGVGLVFSYSRGAWVGAAVGLSYLMKLHGKFKWRYVMPGILVALAVPCFFWNATPDTVPWYVKRLDLGRPSAQHRVAAWKAGLLIMRDHPWGVGWDKAVATYEEHYSPPEKGAGAITTNDYLMLGTELGLPGLICFVAYVGLRFKSRPHIIPTTPSRLFLSKLPSSNLRSTSPVSTGREHSRGSREGITASPSSLQAACRAGALAMLAAFWFDSGLFKLATAAVFWILLELGTECPRRKEE